MWVYGVRNSPIWDRLMKPELCCLQGNPQSSSCKTNLVWTCSGSQLRDSAKLLFEPSSGSWDDCSDSSQIRVNTMKHVTVFQLENKIQKIWYHLKYSWQPGEGRLKIKMLVSGSFFVSLWIALLGCQSNRPVAQWSVMWSLLLRLQVWVQVALIQCSQILQVHLIAVPNPAE